MSIDTSDIPRPPNPPRDVAQGYAMKQLSVSAWFIVAVVFIFIGIMFLGIGVPAFLTTQNELGIGGSIFAFLGIVFLGFGLIILFARIRQIRRLVHVMREGREKLGEVVSAGYNFNVTINNRHPYRIKYTFRPLGGDVKGEYETMDHRAGEIETGSPIYVLYDPDEPEYNTLYPHWEEADQS